MIDPNGYYIVVCRRAIEATGVDREEIQRRICSGKIDVIKTEDYIRFQPTYLVNDGRCHWKVTLSDKVAPDGFKRLAYVVEGERHREDYSGRNLEKVK